MEINQIVEERNDREMILTPEAWPIWPVLPLKKRGEWETGFLLFGHGLKVYIGTIFLAVELSELKSIQYSSVDELLAAGWVVD